MGKRPGTSGVRNNVSPGAGNAAARSPAQTERIQKVLSRSGVCSRRAAEELVREGRLSVNGNVVVSQGLAVSNDDVVMVDGKVVNTTVGRVSGSPAGGQRAEWIALHKTKGVLCADRDKQGRKTLIDMLGKQQRVDGVGKYAVVGKLEAGASGLVVLSTDKSCAVALNGRDCAHVREYEVIVKGHVTEENVKKLQAGVSYGSGEGRVSTLPAELDVLELSYDFAGVAGGSRGKSVKFTIMNWRLRETRQRMIGRMCESVQHELVSVKCLAFGPVRVGGLKKGSSRFLTPNEVKALKRGIKGPDGEQTPHERSGVFDRRSRGRSRS